MVDDEHDQAEEAKGAELVSQLLVLRLEGLECIIHLSGLLIFSLGSLFGPRALNVRREIWRHLRKLGVVFLQLIVEFQV